MGAGQGGNRFFHRAKGPVCLFSPPVRAVVWFYQNGAEGAHHNPLNPLNQPAFGGPNPLNPRGVSRVLNKKYLYPLKDKIE